jgi:DNA-binding transcriptional LysR family regulator
MATTRYADALTLDQLEIFAEVVDAGSFTRAAKRLRRAQSAVSYGVGRLEDLLGVQLLERSLTGARPTQQGQILLAEARQVLGRVDHLRAAGLAFSEKVEPEVSISVSPIFPLDVFGAIAREMRERFPHTQLRVYGGNLGANVQDVSSGRATIGISGLSDLPSHFAVVPCGLTVMTKVVGPGHPLATCRGAVPDAELKKHLQLVATDTTELTKSLQINVLSPRTWRIADTMIRYQMVLAGVGWTHFARAWIAVDIAAGRLVELPTDKKVPASTFTLRAFYRVGEPLGPAGRWLVERLSNASNAASPLLPTPSPRRRGGSSKRNPRRGRRGR